MRYRICHRTSYDYSKPVFESFNEVRLQPLACATQTLLDFDLVIQPPATVIAFRDYYGNAVHDFGVPYLHERLVIEATSDVVTHAGEDEPIGGPDPDEDDASLPLADVAEDAALSDEFAEFLGASSYIVLADDSAELARSLLAEDPGTSALEFLYRAVAHVRSSLEYRLGTTTVNSSVAEVLAGGSGVCQDFAHVLISLCRNVGLPARYVSGYLGGVESSTASHAWAEAYIPPYGWVAVDATIGTRCTGRHVIVGMGRDYADVAVLSGTYQGGGQATLDVQVECQTLGGSDAMAQLRGGSAPIARLVAIQNLGAMRQFQRGTVMTQAMGGLTQTLPLDAMPPPREQRSAVNDVPSEQPRQQQQTGASPMRIRVGCLFEHDTVGDAAAIVMVDPHTVVGETVLEQEFVTAPPFEESPFADLYGNRCRRLVLPPGLSTFSYDAIVEISSENEVMPTAADVQHRIEDLPDELLHWLLPSRYIESDVLLEDAWKMFGQTEPGVERVQAVCDWIHGNIAYGVASVQSTSTLEIYARRGGMCRDFAHMGVAFCRALGIPARYVFGYMPDIGIPGPFPPMDFHAWFEVWLGEQWWTFDARFNTPRIGRVPIGHGRDAADVAMITTFGAASLRRMVVWSDEIGEDGSVLPAGLPVEAVVPDVR